MFLLVGTPGLSLFPPVVWRLCDLALCDLCYLAPYVLFLLAPVPAWLLVGGNWLEPPYDLVFALPVLEGTVLVVWFQVANRQYCSCYKYRLSSKL